MGKKAFHGISQEEHKRLRRLTTAALSGQEALSVYLKHIEEIVITSLKEWSTMSKPIEFLTEMRKITFKVIMYVMVGERSTDHSIMEALEKEYTTLNLGLKSMAIDLPGFAYHNALKARKNLQKIFLTIVDERRLEKPKIKQDEKKYMLDMLMGIEDENRGKLSDEEIVDLIIMFLNAGHESSGHAAMWAVVLLQDHPEVFQKAKEEQEDIVSKRPPNQKGLTLKETRQMEYLSKDPKIRANFIPFGAGSRMCPGRDLARLEVHIFLHYFLLNYKYAQVLINPSVLS